MNQDMINKINRVPIFGIMNVKGYCVYIVDTPYIDPDYYAVWKEGN